MDLDSYNVQAKTHPRCRSTSDVKRQSLKGSFTSDEYRDTRNFLAEKSLADLRRVRIFNSGVCEPSLAQDSLNLQLFLQSFRNGTLDEAKLSSLKMVEQIRSLQKSMDENLMASILDYFAILQDEMNATREKLISNSADCSRRKREAKRLRDVIIFSRHVQIETQGAVTFTSIQTDNSQWARCQEAVAENLNTPGMESAGYAGVTVMNAFKLEHKILSRHIQDVGQFTSKSMRVKGLFVSLRKNELYGFCAYGLHAQKYNKDRCVPDTVETSTLPGLFQLPWFCSELSKRNEAFCANERFIPTDNKVREISSFSDSKSHAKSRGYAETLAEDNVNLTLRFSKFSNPHHSRVRNEGPKDHREADDDTFIVLCRVLVDRVVVLDGDVTHEDVEKATQSGYDAIYSRLRKEYLLLKPEYVLPEFLLEFRYTLIEGKGIPSQFLSVSSKNYPEAAPRKDFKDETFAPQPLALINNHSDSSHVQGFECSNKERSKSDFRNIGRNNDVGVPVEITEGRNVLSSMKKQGEFYSSSLPKNGRKSSNMAANHCSYLIDKQNIVHYIKNARVDYIAKRNESLKRECFPFMLI